MSTDWRDYLPVHPACDAYPALPHDELIALGNDIRERGLQLEIVVLRKKDDVARHGDQFQLADGRSRLDAMAAVGIAFDFVRGNRRTRSFLSLPNGERVKVKVMDVETFDDEWIGAYVASLNLHRRHLTDEQKRERYIKVIAAQPERSDRQIAEELKVDHKTIAAARKVGEDVGSIPHVTRRTDTKGRRQPARKTTKKPPPPPAEVETSPPADDPEASAAKRKAENAALDEPTDKPTDKIDKTDKPTDKPADKSEEAKPPAGLDMVSSAKQIGGFLEQLGADRFFAALQYAPALKAAIELRVLGQHAALSSIKPKHDKDATNLLRKGLGTREPAKQILAIGQLNQLLDRRGLTRDDVNVTLPREGKPNHTGSRLDHNKHGESRLTS